ncbi:MAG: hypothetical protein J4G03_00010 [Gemmatimonadetes bacterium]|nr:hypothetical protein [Gemmatimonadota bacterium]
MTPGNGSADRADLYRRIRHGLQAGLLSGASLAVLFLFYDFGQGVPLRTPAFLWGAVTGSADTEPTFPVVAGFSVIHFGAWAGLGVAASLLTRWIGLARNVFIGVGYGMFACSVLFYLLVARVPADTVLAAPDWPAVFFGNAAAGAVMFTYLRWVGREPGMVGLMAFLGAHDVTRSGIYTGLIGAGVLAVWFLIVDSVTGRPLYTPSALAAVLFFGADGAADVVVGLQPVLVYSVAHVLLFMLFGVILSGLTEQVSRFPPLIFGLFILFAVAAVFFVAVVAILGNWVLEQLAWWSILCGNVLSAGAMMVFLKRYYPGLASQLTSESVWRD